MINMKLYKAVHPDGTDFRTGMVQWAPPEDHEGEWIVRHPTATEIGDHASEYLSVSTVVTNCAGMEWPCRLLTVEAVGVVTIPEPVTMPNKRAGVAFRVTGEIPAHAALGPQGVHVAALVERIRRLTLDETRALTSAWDAAVSDVRSAAWDTEWDAALGAALDAACSTEWNTEWDAAWDAAWVAGESDVWDAACDAALALVVRDLIATDQYDTLTRPWRTVIGPIHPDDAN